MQDWNYLQTNCFEVTIELGCVKYPFEKDLPKFLGTESKIPNPVYETGDYSGVTSEISPRASFYLYGFMH